jgi:sarcosine oxidase subunit beta
MGSASAPLPDTADIAIVGGGIMGLATAYNLARLSRLRVVVIERGYLASGASGRNGGGVRAQFGDAGNVGLMVESLEICRGLAQELGINVWFRRGGYLFLARSEDQVARLERNAAIHREFGLATRLLDPHEAREVVPELDVSGVRVAAFNPDDGVVFPWAFLWGYAAQAVARGVVVRTHTGVRRLEPVADGYRLALSTGETLEALRVVNATGAWSNRLNRTVGFELPNHPHRHEILATEPLKPFLEPLVAELQNGLYFSQSTRGEIITGIGMPAPDDEDDTTVLDSSFVFLVALGRALCRVLPLARSLKVLRQWAGPYDPSPDGDPIVGPSPGHPDLVQLCGFTGHGFMMAPAVGRIVARWLARAEHHPLLDRWDPLRFERGEQRAREDMIIG